MLAPWLSTLRARARAGFFVLLALIWIVCTGLVLHPCTRPSLRAGTTPYAITPQFPIAVIDAGTLTGAAGGVVVADPNGNAGALPFSGTNNGQDLGVVDSTGTLGFHTVSSGTNLPDGGIGAVWYQTANAFGVTALPAGLFGQSVQANDAGIPIWGGPHVVSFLTSGTYNAPFTGNVIVCGWGGGGGGGGGAHVGTSGSGGGGGGGSIASCIPISVSAGSYTVTVGAGGAGGAFLSAGTQGGTSLFGSGGLAYFPGGSGGGPGSTAAATAFGGESFSSNTVNTLAGAFATFALPCPACGGPAAINANGSPGFVNTLRQVGAGIGTGPGAGGVVSTMSGGGGGGGEGPYGQGGSGGNGSTTGASGAGTGGGQGSGNSNSGAGGGGGGCTTGTATGGNGDNGAVFVLD